MEKGACCYRKTGKKGFFRVAVSLTGFAGWPVALFCGASRLNGVERGQMMLSGWNFLGGIWSFFTEKQVSRVLVNRNTNSQCKINLF